MKRFPSWVIIATCGLVFLDSSTEAHADRRMRQYRYQTPYVPVAPQRVNPLGPGLAPMAYPRGILAPGPTYIAPNRFVPPFIGG